MAATFYYIGITDNFNLAYFEHELPEKKPRFRYIIKSSYLRRSPKNYFYKYELFDNFNNLVHDNTMQFGKISCKIANEDSWANPFDGSSYLVLQFWIKDCIGEVLLLPFKNYDHDLKPFKAICNYVKLLEKGKKHRSLDIEKEK